MCIWVLSIYMCKLISFDTLLVGLELFEVQKVGFGENEFTLANTKNQSFSYKLLIQSLMCHCEGVHNVP